MSQGINSSMTIRRLDLSETDREALARLTERDSAGTLEAPVIGIEVEGRLLAARSLADGAVVADPFSRTDELQAMLELRAGQLTRRTAGFRRGLRISRRRRVALADGLTTVPR
jgi:hypothetical protein